MHNSKVAEITSVFALRQCSALYIQDLPNNVSLFLMTSIKSIRNTQLNTGNLGLKSRLALFQKHLFRNLCDCHSHGQICDLSSARASKLDLRSSLLQPSSCWRTPAFCRLDLFIPQRRQSQQSHQQKLCTSCLPAKCKPGQLSIDLTQQMLEIREEANGTNK